MSIDTLQAQFDFDAIRRHAFWNEARAVLTGHARTLLSFHEVMRVARMEGLVERGVQDIPLSQIKGSEGRSRDFDPSFLPLNPRLRARWTRIETLMLRGAPLPPIEVYKVGEVYFVKDGHHRVSVARHLGQETITANVIEVRTRAPLGPDVDAHELLRTAEYARFLEQTQLDRLRPSARLECSELGNYDVIFEHILGHRYFMSLERGQEVPLQEAVADWYDNVYRPIRDVLEKHHIRERFPQWTEADLYLALTRRWLELAQEGHDASPEGAGESLIHEADESRERSASIMLRRWVRHSLRRTIVLGSALKRTRVLRKL
ncbi:MAG: hypothetical protein DLM67_02835 [Candidatus Nephthysia bennettiae]|uniref:DUF4032 domain-containing protein n=1 Tax=Candidatus Nephthysia bennettiae TaxID=3127016 RepID=A0A934K412_9BACT|nr:hypothetical protein [Candidatus Dormibacteraeota bacterium]MBJ7614312.1 hypothetical protein [Candidatus Dormibacteraeota bacterium]PZR99847.1 MAG: hypothetical protein DLM67_02835 [Candidatus Dormibacteraeota bacterium]